MNSIINNNKQNINKKNIGILNQTNDLRKSILSKNIGKYEMIDLSDEGIGYLSNFYINEKNKPSTLGKDGLLGYTHIYSSDYQKNINKKYNIGEQFKYYIFNDFKPREKKEKPWTWYDDYREYINFNFGLPTTAKSFLKDVFNYNDKGELVNLDHNKFMTTYSVLTDILQYDNIKYAMEKTGVGTVNPNPFASLAGSVVTNINNFNGTDSKLGLITNQVYAHTLKNGAFFNTLRKTRYITPEIYNQIGNKLSTLSVLSSNFRIDDKTGRLLYNIGDEITTIDIENFELDDFEEENRINNDESTHNGLYENIIRNENNYMPFMSYDYKSYNSTFTSYSNKHKNFKNYSTWFEKFDSKINENHYNEAYEKINITNGNDILTKTLDTFTEKNGEIKNGTLISRFHTTRGADETHNKITMFQTAVSDFGLSHGRNLLSKKAYTTGEENNGNPYCRTWTFHHQYDNIKKLIRPFTDDEDNIIELDALQKKVRHEKYDTSSYFATNSVLNKNGLLRIAPTKNDSSIKKCMFSIENLAWKDILLQDYLSPEQMGDNGGRIMWFPPYGLEFNEVVNVNWNGNDFIGRGEKIYTYTNTERSGTLSFILLVDHPSKLNEWCSFNENNDKDDNEQSLLRFFAGADMLDSSEKKYTNHEEEEVAQEDNLKDDNIIEGDKIICYAFFPHNYSNDKDWDKTKGNLLLYAEEENGKLNKDINELKKYKDFKDATISLCDFLDSQEQHIINYDEIKHIKLYGYSSSEENKLLLSGKRAKEIKEIISKSKKVKKSKIKIINTSSITCKLKDKGNKSGESVIKARCVKIEITPKKGKKIQDIYSIHDTSNLFFYKKYISPQNDVENIVGNNIKNTDNYNGNNKTVTKTTTEVTDDIRRDNESLYFSMLEKNDNILYTKLVDKIKYFTPAFHSITPEGFNSRLAFLHQCTRQGPTNGISDNSRYATAGNMAFGRPPICILRIGDFYHTKIIISSVNINYDTPQWDLNPEGIGVQPMFAKISLNFTFLGGSDLSKPISKLQNAVSFNYYANQKVYDNRTETNISLKK